MRWGWGVDVTSQACSNEPFPPLLFLKISKIICLYPLTINVQTPHVPTFWVNLLRINDQPLHPHPHPPTPPPPARKKRCTHERIEARIKEHHRVVWETQRCQIGFLLKNEWRKRESSKGNVSVTDLKKIVDYLKIIEKYPCDLWISLK